MAGVTLIVGLSIFENEAVGALQTIRAFLYTVRAVFEMRARHAVVWARAEAGEHIILSLLTLGVTFNAD